MSDKEEAQLDSHEPSCIDRDLPAGLWDLKSSHEVLVELANLKERAHKKAQHIWRSYKTLASLLAEIAPLLSRVKLILSQRGRDHHLFRGLDLPSWKEWAEEFVAEAQIGASWSSIKRAIFEYEGGRAPAALHSKKAVPSNKLFRQRIAHAALLALELERAFDEGLDHEDALGQLRDLGITRDAILDELKRLGVMEVPDFSMNHKTNPFSGSARQSQSGDISLNLGDFKPGGWSQFTNLFDRTVGPALRVVANVEDPEVQMVCIENIVSNMTRTWVPFDSNLGTIEVEFRFAPKRKPVLTHRETVNSQPELVGTVIDPHTVLTLPESTSDGETML